MNSGINDDDLVAAIAEQLQIPPEEARTTLAAIIDVITEALANNRRVILKGFGTFEVIQVRGEFGHRKRTRRQRMVMLPSSREPHFRAGAQLLRAINNHHPSTPPKPEDER